jgi:DEAD/DEAH box helicase domain-containing protein
VRELVHRLATADRAERLTHVEALPPRAATYADWPEWVHPDVRDALAERGATTLYVAPTKALAQDQLASLQALGLGVRTTTHDGDSSREQRDWARDHGEYLLTNPDMLHRSLLPGHARWARFFGSLQYVVIDECHHYRGVFGAHVSHVLRRLRRVCASYGAHPTFVLASATVAEPDVLGERLTGLPVTAVTEDASPRGQVVLGLWEPPFTGHLGENGAPVRRAATSEVADLLADLVVEGVHTLAFVRSRRGAESVARTAAGLLEEVDPSLAGRVAPYRGGYLPEERRALEQALRSGRLMGLAATNALELGIDVSGLDAVLMAGFPGTRAALWQQVGRAGRGGQDALGVMVARDDPLDTYLVNHPEMLLGRPVEAIVFDPANHYVLGPHLCAAAEEAPLTEADLPLFGPTAREVVDRLTEAGLLRRRSSRWFWTDRRRASDLADIRSTGGRAVQLVETGTGRVVGTVDASASHGTAHEGAVYVHLGETYLVRSLDLEESVAVIERADPDYSTSAREVIDIRVIAEREHVPFGECLLSLGEVEVGHQVVSYLKRRVPSGEVIAEEPLDLPERTLRTTAVWWTVPQALLEESGIATADLPGAAHAAEHASIGLLPLFATCDRWDIGGVSTALHPDTGRLTVFVYDGHPGGAGFAERGYAVARAWLTATREAILGCACTEGCPSCVQSPKCGNQNHPLDKAAAVDLLDLLLGVR